MAQKIIQQGAEAKIILVKNDIRRDPKFKGGVDKGEPLVPFIIKDRIPKSYRLPELDKKIRKQRTKSESKLLEKASEIINVPLPINSLWVGGRGSKVLEGGAKIIMPYIQGKKLSENLDEFPLKKQKEICKIIGQEIAKLHDADIIHGDLTTSNMILLENKKDLRCDPKFKGEVDKENLGSLYFIDFGLGYISKKFEDKAVDLHLLKQALEAKHFKNWKELLEEVFKGYKNSKNSKIVFERLKAVEKRGRYKH